MGMGLGWGMGMGWQHSHPHLQAVTSFVLMTFLTNILPEQSTQGALVRPRALRENIEGVGEKKKKKNK